MKTKKGILAIICLLYQLGFAQGELCDRAIPFCTSVGTPFVYTNVSNNFTVTQTSNYGCLGAGVKQNPTWFYCKSSAAGVITFSLIQTVNPNGTGAVLDVNFVAWGPLATPVGICNPLGAPFACSNSASLTETLSINATAAGQYFMILMTNSSNTAGYYTISQTSGVATDCVDACPPDNFTMIGSIAGTTVNVPSGAVVSCTNTIFLKPPFFPLNNNPFHNILTPCITTAFETFTSNINTNGTMLIDEPIGPLNTYTRCPTCASTIGGSSATNGDNYYFYYQALFPGSQHDYTFCKGGGAIGSTTVSLKACWENKTFAGPTLWNNSSPTCFSLTAPANTSIGTASYAIAPSTGSVALLDFYDGYCFVNPSLLVGGQTYTITYTFSGPSNCAPVHGTFTLSTVSPPPINAIASQTFCSGSITNAINISTTPSGGAYSWTNSNLSIGIAATGTTSIAAYTAPVVFGSTSGLITVTPKQAGCNGSPQSFSVTISPKPTTSITAPISTALTCTNNTLPLVGSGGGSYQWTGPGIVSGATSSVVTVNMAGTYSLQITVAGCTSNNTTITVTQNNTAPTLSVSNSGTITCTNTTITLTASTSATTIAWSGPSSGTLTGVSPFSIPITVGGTYSISVIGSNGCKTNTTIAIAQNISVPTFTLATAKTVSTTCASPNATLSGNSSADPATLYQWLTPVSTTLTGNPVSTAIAGVYTIVVTNTVNGCSNALSPSTVQVVPDAAIPSLTLSTSTVSLTCNNTTVTVAVNANNVNVTYSWSPNTGIVSGGTTANPVFNAIGSYSVVGTNTLNSCSSNASSNVVTVVANTIAPTVSLSSGANSATLNCSSPSIIITPTITPSGNNSYTWSPATGMASSVNQANATFTATGIYTLAVTNTITGCVSLIDANSTFTVYANANTPTVSLITTSSNTSIACGANASVSFSANVLTSGGSVIYNWLPSITTNATATMTVAGSQTLIVTDAVSGCSATVNFTVNSDAVLPNLSTNAAVLFPCDASTLSLTASSTSTNVSYTWQGPSLVLGANTANATVSSIGIYTVTVTDLISNCVSSQTVSVTQASITALFTANPTSGSMPLTVNFTNQTVGTSNTYQWFFSNGSTSTLTNPTTVFTKDSNYVVTLVATLGVCTSSATLLIMVDDGVVFSIPQFFTPNGDNKNEFFEIAGIKKYPNNKLEIYNRWGSLVYKKDKYNNDWNGKTNINNKEGAGVLPASTYFVVFDFGDGQTPIYKGYVELKY